MINCWFNEQGFLIKGPKIQSHLLANDCPTEVYDARWYMFGLMMDALLGDSVESITDSVIISHDSRLVEELTNKLDPLNPYAKAARTFFLMQDRPLLRLLDVRKVNSNTINRMIESGISEQKGPPAATPPLRQN